MNKFFHDILDIMKFLVIFLGSITVLAFGALGIMWLIHLYSWFYAFLAIPLLFLLAVLIEAFDRFLP